MSLHHIPGKGNAEECGRDKSSLSRTSTDLELKSLWGSMFTYWDLYSVLSSILPHNTRGFGLGLSVICVIPTTRDNGKPLNLKYFKEITFLHQTVCLTATDEIKTNINLTSTFTSTCLVLRSKISQLLCNSFIHADMFIEFIKCRLNISFHYLICRIWLTAFNNRIKWLWVGNYKVYEAVRKGMLRIFS